MNIIELIHKGIVDFRHQAAGDVTRIFVSPALIHALEIMVPPVYRRLQVYGVPVIAVVHIPDNAIEMRDDLTGQVIQISFDYEAVVKDSQNIARYFTTEQTPAEKQGVQASAKKCWKCNDTGEICDKCGFPSSVGFELSACQCEEVESKPCPVCNTKSQTRAAIDTQIAEMIGEREVWVTFHGDTALPQPKARTDRFWLLSDRKWNKRRRIMARARMA